ncbi:biopolymer transporter ExbD [Dysgonomonas sp. 25]|uniref:ExbD/TolR family protein n=1 Tax=Dysgonomonas sp. 25 TaxID=2302933 RepID=UPI0013D2D977|nr:biopolymer transporter ExbD [Dysgonomonas sp. 25]NDV69721.1 biopolymer transporter ExbD [Dysgonomonas sp. 25]
MAKGKKHDIFIDMTAMSDVCVLLLTFFMLTATFKPKEPVEIIAPQSVSETKVPEHNVVTILIDIEGQVFMQVDGDNNKSALLNKVAAAYGLKLNEKQRKSFITQPSIGVAIKDLPAFLNLSMTEQDQAMKKLGIPTDTAGGARNELADWIRFAREINEDEIKFGIKADANTPYPKVDLVMKTMVAQKANRYSLMTSLRAMPDIAASN